ncbi:lipopolysaccharide assembly protein LapB [Chitinibacteraceae bacterium HSL-7]
MDELSYWWLVAFPVCFGLGWLAARIDIKHVLSEARSLPAQYFKGLHLLLAGKTREAVEVYVDIAKLYPQTVDLQFTLGHLFRSRGELERAIHMHQTLTERPDISAAQKQEAQFELARDFLKSGLFDRAEAILIELANSDYAQRARAELLAVYEQEKAWLKAIEVAQAMRDDSHSYQHEIAQFYCELGEMAFARSQPDEAERYIHAALSENRKCARARILLGELRVSAGDTAAAIAEWQAIETQDVLVLALVARKLLAAFDASGRGDEGTLYLMRQLELHPDLDVVDVLAERLLTGRGAEEAHRFVRERLRAHPTLAGLSKFLEMHAHLAPDDQKPDLEIIGKLLTESTRDQTLYYCASCGFKARQYFWHCPACAQWETYPAVRGRRNAALNSRANY